MFLSKKLLSKINPNFSKVNNSDLVSALNAIGIEVEQIIENKVSNDLVVGRLISFEKHSNSDHLNVCNVVVNNKKWRIVCGAENLKNDQWVVVALEGAKVNSNLIIEKRNIRGIESEGMLCAMDEILPNNHHCIDDLDKKTIIQIPYQVDINPLTFFDDLGFNDTIFELSIPSNRPELNGVYFLAYELNLQFNFLTEKVKPYILFAKKNKEINIKIDEGLKLNYNLVKFDYDFSEINSWKIKLCLINSNIKTQNHHANLINYLKLLFSQPIISINNNKIQTNINVTTLKHEIEFVDENNIIHKLKPGTIVTTNNNNEIISVTGRYLSNQFINNLDSKEMLLEIVNFDSSLSNKQNELNKFNDENAVYYIKNLSRNIPLMMLNYINKHQQLFNLKNIKIINISKHDKNKILHVNKAKINKFLGVDLKSYVIYGILRKIGISYFPNLICIPGYRKDLNTIADIVEELIKGIDINNLEAKPIKLLINDFKVKNANNNYKNIVDYLINKGFYEVKTYNLTNENDLNNFNWFNCKNDIKISNYISNNHSVLRHNNISQLLQVLKHNIQHKQEMLNIFEIQKIQLDNENTIDILSCVICQDFYSKNLSNNVININDYSVKSLINGLIDINNTKFDFKYNQNKFNELDKNNMFIYSDNEFVGLVGKLNKELLINNYSIEKNVYCISINLTNFVNANKNKFILNKVSEYNPIYKNLTFSNPNNILLDQVIESLLKIKYISDVNVIDSFEKNNNKTYTLSLVIQPLDKNLTNDNINDIFWQAIDLIRKMNLVVKEN